MSWRGLRIALLSLLLVAVAGDAWLTRLRTTDWDEPLWVAIYPINADGSSAADSHIQRLTRDAFADVEAFIAREAERYGVGLEQPVVVQLAPVVETLPPATPPRGQRLATAWWSLRFRLWAWQTRRHLQGPPADVDLFVLYHDPERTVRLPHSLGLQKGMIGMVQAFADRGSTGRNHIVIAHELLHTLGATDKYDPTTNVPLFPEGYAEPDQRPRLPQTQAEVMAGRIPMADGSLLMPRSLAGVVVGRQTAREINWIE